MKKNGIKKRTIWKKTPDVHVYIFYKCLHLAENYHLPLLTVSTVPKEYTEYFLLIQSKTFTCSSPCVYFHAPLWKSVYVLVQVFPSTNQESKIIKTKESINHEQETAVFSLPTSSCFLLSSVWRCFSQSEEPGNSFFTGPWPYSLFWASAFCWAKFLLLSLVLKHRWY